VLAELQARDRILGVKARSGDSEHALDLSATGRNRGARYRGAGRVLASRPRHSANSRCMVVIGRGHLKKDAAGPARTVPYSIREAAA